MQRSAALPLLNQSQWQQLGQRAMLEKQRLRVLREWAAQSAQ